MEISLCKILKDCDISFLFYLKNFAKYFDKIIIISEKNFAKDDNYFKALNEISNSFIFEKIDDYYSHEFIKKTFELIETEYLLLLEENEYIREDFFKIIEENDFLSKNIYALPVIINSKLQNVCIYKPKIFNRNYKINDDIGIFENYIYSSKTQSKEELKKSIPILENLLNFYKIDEIKFSYANLLALTDSELKAIKKYKDLISNSKNIYIKSKASFNLSCLYKDLDLKEKYMDFLNESYLYDKKNPLTNYFLALEESDNNKKINYYKKVLEYKPILEKWENFISKEYLEKASLVLAEFETDISKKNNFYKRAHFYSPDNIETQTKLFELIKSTKNFDNPKLSVVIPSCNNFDFLTKTIRTLIINTNINLEIIVIEDGIVSEIAIEFYEKNKWIKVFKNEKNLGFVKSINKGVKLATCDYILILNDDVFITSQAIDILFENISNDNQIGAIAPWQDDLFLDFFKNINLEDLPYEVITENIFNNSFISFNSIFETYQFAKENLIKNKNICITANQLSGFCLMMPKKLIDEISLNCGLLDEIYGFGYFDDLDLCERIKRHGYKLKISLGSIVYHFMSVSVKKEKIKQERLSNRNREIFFKKWFPNLQLTPNIKKDSLSLCMIVKNEEENLERCLESIDSICNEIILVDTGSQDNTLNIAEKFGAKIHYYKWDNDFSKARNTSISLASMEWILWLDGDDYIQKEDINKLKDFLKQDNFTMARMPIISTQENNKIQNLYQYRLFRNRHNIYFKNFIHEAPIIKGNIFDLDVKIFHSGYFDSKIEKQKLERNIKIIEFHLESKPFDEYALFQYINSLFQYQDFEKVIKYSEKFLENIKAGESNKIIFYQVYMIYSKALFLKVEIEKTLKNAFNALDLIPSLPEAYLWLGFVFKYLKLYDYAIFYYQKVLELTPPKFNGENVDLEVFKIEPMNEINEIKNIVKTNY